MQQFKKKIITSLFGLMAGTSAYALNCDVVNLEKMGWQANITFQCNEAVNALANPVSFQLTNGAEATAIWGLANPQDQSLGNLVKVGFKQWSGAPYIVAANTPVTFTYGYNAIDHEIANFKVGQSGAANSTALAVEEPNTPEQSNLATSNTSDPIVDESTTSSPMLATSNSAQASTTSDPIVEEAPTEASNEKATNSLNCSVVELDKQDWQADITFECDQDVDLESNPVAFELTNGTTSSGVWGIADPHSEGSGSLVKVGFTDWSGNGYILKANTPATFTYSHNNKNHEIENFRVGDSSVESSDFSASFKLTASATPSVPSKPIIYRILNSDNEEVATGEVSFSSNVIVDLPLAVDEKEAFVIEFGQLYENVWLYKATPIVVELSPNQQAFVDVTVKGEAYEVMNFNTLVSLAQNFDKPVEIKFLHGNGVEVILPIMHGGADVMQLPKDTGEWSIELPQPRGYTVTSNVSTIDTNSVNPQSLSIVFEEKEINTSGNILQDLLTEVAQNNGYNDAESYYQDLFAFHLSADVQNNPGLYADFKVSKTANAGATAYFAYPNMIEAYQRLASNQLSSDFMSTFLANTNDYDNLREIAAFFANVGQETNGGTVFTDGTFTQAKDKPASGLMYAMSAVSEGQCYVDAQTGTQNFGCNYDHAGAQVDIPGLPGVQYYGRGPKQLSYPENYFNYGHYAFDENGNYLDANGQVAIFANPDLVVTDPVRGWQTAFAFMIKADTSNQFFKKPSMTQAMHNHSLKEVMGNETKHGPAGFGHAINVINGGIECKTDEVVYQQINRINNYIELLIRFGVPIEKVDVKMNDGSYYDASALTIQAMKERVYPESWAKTAWGSYIIHTQPLPVDLYNYNTKKGPNAQHIIEIVLYYGAETGLEPEVLSCGVGFQPYGL